MIVFVTGLLALAFFAPAIVAGQVPIFRDFVNVFLPFRIYTAHALAAGRLPLWAPEAAFGVPFVANYQSAVLYPPSVIIDVLPNPIGVGLYLALHFWMAGIGIDLLLRRRGLPARARLLGAFVMMLGGIMISLTAGNHISVVAWIPLSIVAAEDLVDEPRPLRFLWFVFLVTVQALAGAPETFAQSAVLIAAAAVVASLRRQSWSGFVLVGLGGVLAVALSAPQLVTTAEYFSETERSTGLSAEMALVHSFEPKTLMTLFSPHRLDRGIVTNIPEVEVPLFWSIYVGIVPILLAGIGFVTRRGRLWALVLAASLVLALGTYTPVYPFLYRWFPKVVGAFRYPQKFLFTAHIAVSILAACGFAWLEERAAALRRPIPQLFGGMVIVTTLVDLWAVHQPSMLFYDWQSLLESPPRGIVREGSDARIFQYEVTRSGGIQPWLPVFMIGTSLRTREAQLWARLSTNVPLAYGLGYVNCFDSMSELRPSMDALFYTIGNSPLAAELRLLGNLGVRFLVGERAIDDPTLETVQRGEPEAPWIYRLPAPAPRIFLARRVRLASSPREAFHLMSDESFQPGEDAVVADSPPSGELAAGSARLVENEAESLTIEVESSGAALLIVGDSFFPGWRAAIDGESASMLRANGGLARALPVPPGKHAITMKYRPRSFCLGLAIFAGALIAVGCVAGLLSQTRPRRTFVQNRYTEIE